MFDKTGKVLDKYSMYYSILHVIINFKIPSLELDFN
jgi:hypothetical protein